MKFRAVASLLLAASSLIVGQPPSPNAQLTATRNRLEKELEDVAIIERKVMVPMSDGKRMAADIYRRIHRKKSRSFSCARPTISTIGT